MPWSKTPGKLLDLAGVPLIDTVWSFVLTSASLRASSFPLQISGLNSFNLSAYGLPACVLRLKFRITAVPPRISYPAATSLPGRDSHPLDYATLPSRTRFPDPGGNGIGTFEV